MEVVRYASAAYGYDGVGEMILPGPEGALSTLHFENYRDGLEDHGYYRHPDSITFLCRLQTATNTHAHTLLFMNLWRQRRIIIWLGCPVYTTNY